MRRRWSAWLNDEDWFESPHVFWLVVQDDSAALHPRVRAKRAGLHADDPLRKQPLTGKEVDERQRIKQTLIACREDPGAQPVKGDYRAAQALSGCAVAIAFHSGAAICHCLGDAVQGTPTQRQSGGRSSMQESTHIAQACGCRGHGLVPIERAGRLFDSDDRPWFAGVGCQQAPRHKGPDESGDFITAVGHLESRLAGGPSVDGVSQRMSLLAIESDVAAVQQVEQDHLVSDFAHAHMVSKSKPGGRAVVGCLHRSAHWRAG